MAACAFASRSRQESSHCGSDGAAVAMADVEPVVDRALMELGRHP